MTSVTQKIPNYVGGISQQPDELMPLGSLRDAVNVIPDVTDGLRKRSGSRLINPLLTEKQGSWFHFNYADNQKYIGKVNYDGTVHMFSVADGLPVPVTYKDWEYEAPKDAYPDCDRAAVQAAKEAWQAKVDEYNIANAQLTDLVNKQGGVQREETDVRVRVERDTAEWGQRFKVYEGYVRKNGPDFIIPETKNGWNQRRGNIVSIDGQELKGVTVLVWQTFDDFEGWQRYTDCDVYENVFYRTVTDAPDYSAEIDVKRDQVKALKDEVDDLYADYAAEVAKCGYAPDPNIRAIIDADVPPKYLQHDLPMQIKTLVVGDTIFLTNPSVAVSMEQNSFDVPRATENYIELTTVAGNKVYTIELVDETTRGQAYNRVTKVSVIDGEYQDSDGACPLQGTAQEIFNDGEKVNLDISLTVTGNQVLEGNGNSPSDYECKYISTARINNGGANWEVGDIVTMEVTGKRYKIRVEEVEQFYSSRGEYLFPPQTPNGTDAVVKADQILSDLKAVIEAKDSNFQVEIIGNGIYITHNDPEYTFTFATPEGQLMNVVTQEVNNITDLPSQCKGGYVVKIANTDSENDDYWAKFVTEFNGMDGPGAWEETVAPGYNTVINAGTMPHKLVRTQAGAFVVSPIEWESRLVGDDKTNPRPSFISRLQQKDYRFINKMAFFRNRLCMLSGDNVVCSKPGDYYNFWYGSALTQADNDPIDIAVGSTSSSANATLLDAIEIGEGLLTFTENEQHVLSTDSEVFGPRTARFNRVGTYRYNGQVSKRIRNVGSVEDQTVVRGAQAFSLGNSIGFLSDAGLNSKLMEIYNIGRTTEANANELSKPVSRLVPWGINAIADSKDNNIIALAKRNTKDVWVYRYFDNDQERVQSAWFRWTMLGTMVYHCIMDDVYWYVSIGTSSSVGIPEEDRDIVSLQRVDLKDELATAFVQDKYLPSAVAGEPDIRADNGTPFQAHLDNYRIAQPSEFTYYGHINQTYFRAPLVYYKDEVDAGNLVAYMLSPTIFQRDSEYYGEDNLYYFVKIGSAVPIRVEEDNLGTWFVMDGDWSKTRMMIGYQYEMRVEMPTLYPAKTQPTARGSITRTDTRAYVNLHRLKINFGQTGVYETTLKVRGRDDYTELYECKTMDEYPANEVAFDQVKTQTVPVYAKNTDTNIVITSTHPSPATINSMEWEGDYSPKFYKSV